MATPIHPQGDIILVTKGPDPKLEPDRLLVKSTFLAHASPVFATMFSDRFAEGQNLSVAAPKEITVDDDPWALYVLMKLLHLSHKNVEVKPTAEQMYDLVILVDKYDCYDSVSLTLTAWLQLLKFETLDARSWALLAGVYGVLGDRLGYWDATRMLALRLDGPWNHVMDREIIMLAPSEIGRQCQHISQLRTQLILTSGSS